MVCNRDAVDSLCGRRGLTAFEKMENNLENDKCKNEKPYGQKTNTNVSSALDADHIRYSEIAFLDSVQSLCLYVTVPF